MLRRTISSVLVLGLTLIACGDDETTATASTSTASGVTDTTPPSPATPQSGITLDLPDGLSAVDSISAETHPWFSELHHFETGSAVGYLGTGVSVEPATVIDPQASIAANQALAAAHGVAGDLLDSPGDAQVLTQEETTLASGHPAQHVRLRFHGVDPAADVDLIGTESNGYFRYGAAVSVGLDAAAAQVLFDSVASAALS